MNLATKPFFFILFTDIVPNETPSFKALATILLSAIYQFWDT